MKTDRYHKPVMVNEILDYLHIKKGSKVIDATLGTAGHALEMINLGADVLGIEADKKILEIAQKRVNKACQPLRLKSCGQKVKLVHANFRNIKSIAKEHGFDADDGIIFDLGVNTLQLTDTSRGMSFTNLKANLDMRLDPDTQDVMVCDLVNGLREDQLMEVFGEVMEYKEAKKLTKRILKERKVKAITKVGDLTKLIDKPKANTKIHPATKAFMALRIAVNSELENISEVLPDAFELLKTGGRLVVISFHSGEDGLVKNYFKSLVKQNIAIQLTKKPVSPSENEISGNPKSRSAKLRAIEKK